MTISVKEVQKKQELKEFLTFPMRLYRDCPNYVPPLLFDEFDTFNPKKNPAYESAETRLFLARRDGQTVGRIACILSHVANEKYGTRNLRFGWFDAIDDQEVVNRLFQAAEAWGKEKGMTTITGPQGFTDMDSEGMLIYGFDELPTIAYYYSLPYLPELTENYGFEKEVDYHEFQCHVPDNLDSIPPKLFSLSERIAQRGNYRLLRFPSKKALKKRAHELFDIIDEAFDEIYGAVPLTRKQVNYYVKKYFGFVDKDLIKAVISENNEMIGFIITMPSLSRAMQKARGRLFPFGWFHLLRGLKSREILDFYLAGVKKSYQGKGVDLLMGLDIAKTAVLKGFKYSESNVELEDNTKVQAMWKFFNPQLHKKRRIFIKKIH